MQKHTKIYMKHFKYDIGDFIPCEISGMRTNDIHHIDCKGMGGSKEKDFIENLMASTRDLHVLYGDKKQYMLFLENVHSHFMSTRTPYIEHYPHDKNLDILLTTNLKDELIRRRRNDPSTYSSSD